MQEWGSTFKARRLAEQVEEEIASFARSLRLRLQLNGETTTGFQPKMDSKPFGGLLPLNEIILLDA